MTTAVLLASSTLVVCIVILRSLRDPVATEVTLTDFLVHEIVAEQPLLLSSESRIPALEYTANPADSPATTEQA